eukprot:tig00000900_g5386.t1
MEDRRPSAAGEAQLIMEDAPSQPPVDPATGRVIGPAEASLEDATLPGTLFDFSAPASAVQPVALAMPAGFSVQEHPLHTHTGPVFDDLHGERGESALGRPMSSAADHARATSRASARSRASVDAPEGMGHAEFEPLGDLEEVEAEPTAAEVAALEEIPDRRTPTDAGSASDEEKQPARRGGEGRAGAKGAGGGLRIGITAASRTELGDDDEEGGAGGTRRPSVEADGLLGVPGARRGRKGKKGDIDEELDALTASAFSVKSMRKIKSKRRMEKGDGLVGDFEALAKPPDEKGEQYLRSQVERVCTQLPRSIRLQTVAEAYPVVLSAVRLYIGQLGLRSKIAQQGIMHLRGMAAVLGKDCEL